MDSKRSEQETNHSNIEKTKDHDITINEYDMKPNSKKIELLDEYIKKNRDLWAREDLSSWINDLPITSKSKEWHKSTIFSQKVDNRVYKVFKKETNTNPETVFYYWNGHPVQSNFLKTIDILTLLIKETYRWTPIFTNGDLLHVNIGERYYVWNMLYEPTKPIFDTYLVNPRRLIGIFSVKILEESEYPLIYKDEKDIKIAVISLRSVPEDLVPLKIEANNIQIKWHGIYFLIGKGDVTYIHKFDSEDEGGWLLQPITDAAFPDYVLKEAVGTTKFIYENGKYIQEELDKMYEYIYNHFEMKK
jgi:hypothetical protein